MKGRKKRNKPFHILREKNWTFANHKNTLYHPLTCGLFPPSLTKKVDKLTVFWISSLIKFLNYFFTSLISGDFTNLCSLTLSTEISLVVNILFNGHFLNHVNIHIFFISRLWSAHSVWAHQLRKSGWNTHMTSVVWHCVTVRVKQYWISSKVSAIQMEEEALARPPVASRVVEGDRRETWSPIDTPRESEGIIQWKFQVSK